MAAVVALIKPILLAFLVSAPVKQLVVDILRALVKESENTLDDAAVDLIAGHLGAK